MFTNHANESGAGSFHPRQEPQYPAEISQKVLDNLFDSCDDFQKRTVEIGGTGPVTVSVCWLDGLTSGTNIAEDVLRPLSQRSRFLDAGDEAAVEQRIIEGAVYSYSVKRRDKLDDVVSDLVNGFCAILFNNGTAVTFEVKSDKMRSIESATLEKSVKGSKDAFIETLRVNTSLVRKKLRTPQLKSTETVIGRKSRTGVSVMYVDGVAEDERVRWLLEQLDAIDIDGLTAAGNLEQYVTAQPRSPFPQMLHTERPDTFANWLLEGRVGVLVDGLPIGFVMPATLPQLMKVTEDRAQHFLVASMLVVLRYVSLLLGLLLPALYVAVAMYHQEMIPTHLLVSVIDAKQQVPFSTATEVLGMLLAFELLQEAGLRLPNPVGDTVSIIGALIVGQSAVEARVVSPIAVIIVAFSGIASYTLPSQDLASAVRVLRLGLVLAAMGAGIFGVMAAVALLIWHLCTLESSGVAYLSPLVDGGQGGWKWSLLRQPLWEDKYRDPAVAGEDMRRQK